MNKHDSITSKEFIALANKKNINLDSMIVDRFWPNEKKTLQEWIKTTIITYNKLNEDFKDEVDIVYTNLTTILIPCSYWYIEILTGDDILSRVSSH